MEKLLAYLKSLSIEKREAFAVRSGTTLGYLRKAASVGQKFSEGLCLRISVESAGAVTPEDLRPDVDWEYLRAALAPATHSASTDPAIQLRDLDAEARRQLARREHDALCADDHRKPGPPVQSHQVGVA